MKCASVHTSAYRRVRIGGVIEIVLIETAAVTTCGRPNFALSGEVSIRGHSGSHAARLNTAIEPVPVCGVTG